jgi:hypothetical protein
MKKARNLIIIFSLFMFVGSLTSCTASKSSASVKKMKKKRKRGCDCPKWGEAGQYNPDEVIALEDCLYQTIND